MPALDSFPVTVVPLIYVVFLYEPGPLLMLTTAGLQQNARLLLSMGAAIDVKDRGGASPLFRGCFSGHQVTVAVLIGAGADVRHTNSAFETPLYIAALRGHTAAVQLLLDVHLRAGIRWQVQPSLMHVFHCARQVTTLHS